MSLQGGEKVVAEQTEAMGPWGMRIVDANLQRKAEERMRLALAENPWLAKIEGAVTAILKSDTSHRKRYQMMRNLADRINEAIMPQTPCRRGCASCCHIAVEITGWEAERMGRELGLKVRSDAPRGNELQEAQGVEAKSRALFGSACGFLKQGECTIFESRPLACRLHHSLNDDAGMCSTSVPIEESFVPTLNLTQFWMAYAAMSMGSGVGDIAEYFEEAKRG